MFLFMASVLSCVFIQGSQQECDNTDISCIADNSKERGIGWLKSQFDPYYGWKEETHRAITTLYLADTIFFKSKGTKTSLMIKHLELQLALDLLMNHTNPVSAGQIALYINAMLAVCEDPHNFRGVIDLVDEVQNRSTILSTYAFALIALSLHNAGVAPSDANLQKLFSILENPKQVFIKDTQALAILAIISAKNQIQDLNTTKVYTVTDYWKETQNDDGSFGNVYTSGLVMQAMIASKVEDEGWSYENGIKYLISQQKDNGSFDNNILATYFVLPALNNKTMADLNSVKCQKLYRWY